MENKFQFISRWFSTVEISIVTGSDVFQFTIISLEATSEILIPVVLADMAIFSKAKPFKILRVKISRWVADSSIPEKLI